MERLPLFIDLCGQPVLVVGGGTIAARKIRLLIDCGAKVTVLSPQLVAPLLRDLHDRQAIVHVAAHFAPDHLQDQRLVIAATGDRSVNTRVAAAARKQRCWVNVVDDAELSDAIVPSIIDRTPVLVAISSSGAAPVLARRLRERLETLLEPSLGRLASLLQAWRPRLKARWPPPMSVAGSSTGCWMVNCHSA
jgi:uroporphyrin-III C-methyltransferase/precorrin-2 dehydrogenase/sirohydrochlorin ferrochelatase